MSQVNSVKDLRDKHAKYLAQNKDHSPLLDIKQTKPGVGKLRPAKGKSSTFLFFIECDPRKKICGPRPCKCSPSKKKTKSIFFLKMM